MNKDEKKSNWVDKISKNSKKSQSKKKKSFVREKEKKIVKNKKKLKNLSNILEKCALRQTHYCIDS